MRLNVSEIEESKNIKQVVIDKIEEHPMVDFRYLHLTDKCMKFAMGELYKDGRKSKEKFIETLQKFIFDFSGKDSFSMALRDYSSHVNGSTKNIAKKFNYLIDALPEETKKVARDELVHLHLQPNGMGSAVLVGFCVDEIFFVLAVDPKHSLIND